MTKLTWLVVIVGALAMGCAGGGNDEPVSNEDTAGSDVAGDDTEGPEHCEGGFIAGVGDPDQVCAAMVGQCCYESTDDACAALDCDGDCNLAESMPVQVSCQ